MYTVGEILLQTRNITSDFDKDRWDDTKLLTYYNDAVRILAYERDGRTSKSTFPLTTTEHSYIFNGVLKYVSAVDDLGNDRVLYLEEEPLDNLGIFVINHDELYITDPTIGTNITLTYTTMPEEQNVNDKVRSGDEVAIKWFILSNCYAEESDEESVAKETKYSYKFEQAKNKLLGKDALPYIVETIFTTTSYQY